MEREICSQDLCISDLGIADSESGFHLASCASASSRHSRSQAYYTYTIMHRSIGVDLMQKVRIGNSYIVHLLAQSTIGRRRS